MRTAARQDVQRLPTGKVREHLRRKGQFWTPNWIADAMVAFVLGGGASEIFDPAVGAGAFFRAALRAAPGVSLRGTEIAADALDAALESGLRPTDLGAVQIRDFALDPPSGTLPAIVANPPYIRHHRLSGETKDRLRAFCRQFLGHTIDGRAGYHIYFLLRALERLAPQGRLAFIVPADTCEGVFADALWRRLAQRFRLDAVITFAPAAAPFPNVDTNALIVLMTNAPPRDEIHWACCQAPETPALRAWIASDFSEGVPSVFAVRRRLSEALETGFSRSARVEAESKTVLGDFAGVMRGIATGANEFFFLTSAQVAELSLPAVCLRRAVGRTRDVNGDEIAAADLARLDQAGRPTFLLSLGDEPVPPAVRKYLNTGEALALPDRVLIASRHPWYKMEVRVPPPFLFAYLGRRSVRFIRNRAQVLPLTAFLCVYPKLEYRAPAKIEALWAVLSHLETQANLGRVGKSYGDGAIKVEPRALERLPLPDHVVEAAGLIARPRRRQFRLALHLP